MLNSVVDGIKAWLIGLFASAINRTSRVEDRVAAVQWLRDSRDVIRSDSTTLQKIKDLNSLINSRSATIAIAKNVADAVSNYRNSKLSWPMKIALPATLAAIPFVGAHGAGIAAFGTAVGVPVLLLIFLGAAGITSIIEAVITSPESRSKIFEIINVIINSQALHETSKKMKDAMQAQPAPPQEYDMPPEDMAFKEYLYSMDPYDFEKYIMSFFQKAGMVAWVTKKANDFGIDGFAEHKNGIIAVQCKRNAPDHKVGSPTVLHFCGAIFNEKTVLKGYLVTTSTFTKDAIDVAAKVGIVLIDINTIIIWQKEKPSFEEI